jgi:phage-related minor tail protein
MNRRSFLAALGVAPVAAASVAVAAPKAYADGGYAGPLKGYTSGVNIVGEHGPEAIMPLRRAPNGRLGVNANQNNLASLNIKIDASAAREAVVELERLAERAESARRKIG